MEPTRITTQRIKVQTKDTNGPKRSHRDENTTADIITCQGVGCAQFVQGLASQNLKWCSHSGMKPYAHLATLAGGASQRENRI